MATISKNLTVAAKNVYTLSINNIPTGSSVTPVNDIQTWLHCADIWNKTYTTIAQVLNDTSTLQALVASNNAADYMARSTSWASSVVANSNAMSYIGANNYCANKLLANSTWLNAICNSTYFESVLNVKVPTMTSNTTPSGVASASASGSAREPFRVFDGNIGTEWASGYYSFPQWIQYQFPSNVMVNKLSITTNRDFTFTFSASNDGTNFTNLISAVSTSAGTAELSINNTQKYKYYRLVITSQPGTGSTSFSIGQIVTMQMYGRA